MNIYHLLKKYGIRPKKSLGQNFLVAAPTIEKIVRELAPGPQDKILEIGAGCGVMTRILSESAGFVAAVETDKKLAEILENELGRIPNLHIIHGDILDTSLDKLMAGKDRWLFIGNIPYNITAPLLFHLRKSRERFKYGVITIQKEVADRLVASPGSKDYGILSIAIQSVAAVEKCFKISPSSFYPEPKVDSMVVRISFEAKLPYKIPDLDFFTTVVRAAFSTRRKKLKNALAQSMLLDIPGKTIANAIASLGIPESSRAEELDINTFVQLSKILHRDFDKQGGIK